MKLIIDNTKPLDPALIEARLQELNSEHVVGYAVHDLGVALDHVRALANIYPEIMDANMLAVSEILKQCAEIFADLSRKHADILSRLSK